MNIVFLSVYSGLVSRGAETFVDELASRLCVNHEVTVIQGKESKYSRPYLEKIIPVSLKNITINPEGWLRKLFLDYYSLAICMFTLRSWTDLIKVKPQVIIPVNGGWQTLIIKLYCLLFKAKMVVSGQAGLGWDEHWNLLLKPDLFVALTKRNANWAKQYALKQHISIIPNGVDLKTFKPASNEKVNLLRQKLNLKKPIMLCVAGGDRYKRIEETINAVSLLKAGSLLVIGGNAKTHKLGNEQLGSRFSQVAANHHEIIKLYQLADLFTLVSKPSEAFGIAYLEAMATNLPVVATDDELRHELIGKAGLFVKNPEDPQQYAQVIEEALHKKWSDVPRKQAALFSWDMIAKEYENQLLKLYNC